MLFRSFFTTNIYLGRAKPTIGMTGQVGKGIGRDLRCILNPGKLDFSHYFFSTLLTCILI